MPEFNPSKLNLTNAGNVHQPIRCSVGWVMALPPYDRRLDHLWLALEDWEVAIRNSLSTLYTFCLQKNTENTEKNTEKPVVRRVAPRGCYLEAFEQGEQQRVAGDLVDPRRLLADDVAQQGEGGQPAGVLGHALVHLVQKVLRTRDERRRYHCCF